jgi:hypothetical protein
LTKKVLVSSVIIGAALAMNAPAVIALGKEQYHDYTINQQSYKAKYGHWSVLNLPPDVRVNAVHATLLRDGKLLIIAGSGNDPAQFKAGTFKTLLWDPVTDQTKLIHTPADMFCGGHSQLQDGKVLVAGGTLRYEVLKEDVKTAGGTMMVRNEDPNRSRTIPKGTVFLSPDGRQYVSNDALTLPPASKVKRNYTKAQMAARRTPAALALAQRQGRTIDSWYTAIVPSQQAVFVLARAKGPSQVISGTTRFQIQGLTGNDGRTMYGMADSISLNEQQYEGIKNAYEFNPDTERYEPVAPMQYARWYPTLSPLPDGRVLTVSGLDGTGAVVPGNNEIYNPKTKNWSAGPTRYFATYPALFLTDKGEIFYSGANAGYGDTTKGRSPGFWNLYKNTWRAVPGLQNANMTEHMATVMLPPAQNQRMMVFGGGTPGESAGSTARTATIDLSSPNPHFVPGPDLPAGRTRYLNAVTLPDDTVLTTGGSHQYRGEHKSDILKANIYHPDTNTFTPAADPTVGRDYHTEALLLPDGRVVTMGSNPLYNDKADTVGGTFEQRIEIYSPPYLYHGKRPAISRGPAKVTLGKTEHFTTSTPGDVAQIRLIRPSSVTHVTDVQQRSIAVPFTANGNDLSLSIPNNPDLLIPGWYMLFAVDKHGTPSISRWVQVLAPNGALNLSAFAPAEGPTDSPAIQKPAGPVEHETLPHGKKKRR